MDNIITGVISVALFAAFTIGLAESIGALPFAIIVGLVIIMVVSDLLPSIRNGLAEQRAKKNRG